MDDTRANDFGPPTAKVVSFDEALLDACPADQLADILAEAAMLAQAFAPDGQAEHLIAMAQVLSSGQRDDEMGRAHARRLAAALRRLANRETD